MTFVTKMRSLMPRQSVAAKNLQPLYKALVSVHCVIFLICVLLNKYQWLKSNDHQTIRKRKLNTILK